MRNSRAFFVVPITLCSLILLSACSSSVTVTASRLSGIVIDPTITLDVGTIAGSDAAEFKEELVSAVRSNAAFGYPDEAAAVSSRASLLIEGDFAQSYSENSYDEDTGEETKNMVQKLYSARFMYQIIDEGTGTLVIDGALEETKSEKEEANKNIFDAILGAVVEAIIADDPYSPLRGRIVNRFIAEISPHELKVDVTLFEDSDMPELEKGIGFARIGKWKDALGLFLEATEKYAGHEELHKAYYDAGVAYEYDHQYDLARECLEQAFRISAEDGYIGELNRCRRYEQEWKWREGYLEKLRMKNEEWRTDDRE